MNHDIPNSGSMAAIVLAAGTSTRMGAHKLLLPLGDQPIIAHTLAAITACSVSPIVVVLGRDADDVAQQLPVHAFISIVNSDYATGMASSLRTGVGAIPASSTGALVLLGDQPLVTPALVEAVLAVATAHPEEIVSASFAGKRGHPVYFPRRLFSELSAIMGDEGGRSVIARHAKSLRLVDWPNLDEALDADTKEDYAWLQTVWAAHTDGPDA